VNFMPKSVHFAKCGSAAVVLLATAATCGAQVMQAPGTMPNGTRVPFPQRQFDQRQGFHPPQFPPRQAMNGQPGQPAAAPAANAKPAAATEMLPQATPPSLLDKPAQPAKVAISTGGLTVTANNSSLTQILHEISSSTGMTVDGLSKDQRVFGSYGPANPREVLSALLEDSGYNVMMVGANPDGAPKQLFLTPRDTSAPVSGPQQGRPMMQNRDDDADEDVPAPTEPDTPPPGNAVQTPNQPTPPGVVRTPQQMLQELEQMRPQQQSQQPPQ
jgi:hypothetical protein